MPATSTTIDHLLAAVLRGGDAGWPEGWGGDACPLVLERIRYHGLGGLLVEASRANHWPPLLQEEIREQATAQAMWEMRHRQLIAGLAAALSGADVRHVILKGTALAYGFYQSPHLRSRADTDLLVAPHAVATTRSALRRLGFTPSWGEMPNLELAFQEGWELTHGDGSIHQVDLHWQAINARALRDVMPVGECLANDAPLDRLSADSRTLEMARLLLHTCLHRLMHRTAPYVLGGRPYYGGDRLIWAMDLRVLAERLDRPGWDRFTGLAIATGVAPVCLDAFDFAGRTVGIAVPPAQRKLLEAAPKDGAASRYLLDFGRSRRLVHNLLAGGGARSALAFARAQLFPSAEVLRVHYPHSAHLPASLLIVRRWAGLLLPTRRGGR